MRKEPNYYGDIHQMEILTATQAVQPRGGANMARVRGQYAEYLVDIVPDPGSFSERLRIARRGPEPGDEDELFMVMSGAAEALGVQWQKHPHGAVLPEGFGIRVDQNFLVALGRALETWGYRFGDQQENQRLRHENDMLREKLYDETKRRADDLHELMDRVLPIPQPVMLLQEQTSPAKETTDAKAYKPSNMPSTSRW